MSKTRQPETTLAVNSKTGYWEIRWTERNAAGRARTRTYSCRTKDRALAEQVRQTWLTAADHVDGLTLSHTVSDVVDAYVDGHCKPQGVSDGVLYALANVKKFFGPDLIADVSHDRVLAYRQLRAAKAKDATVRKELMALGTAIRWGIKHGVLPADTAPPALALPPETQGKSSYLRKPEEQRLWDIASALALDPVLHFQFRRIGYFVCIALETAARSAAIEGLTWDRVDLAAGRIDFREVGRRVSRKRRVPIPISRRLAPVLADLYARRGSSPYVLDCNGSTRKAWERLRAAHGFEGVNRHDLRRTWATLRAQAGVSMHDIAGVLGDKVETVELHYAVHSPDHLRAAMDTR